MSEIINTPRRRRGRPRKIATPNPQPTAVEIEDRQIAERIKRSDAAANVQPAIEVVLVTVKQAAQALQVCEKTVHNLMTSGCLPSVKILGARRIGMDDIRRLAKTGTAA